MKAIVNVLVLAGVILVISSAAQAGTIYWTPAHELAPQGFGGRMTAGDLDGDGDIDISVLGLDPAHQYWNVGSAASPVWELDLSQYGDVPWCVSRDGDLADLDGDGDLDLAITCWYDDFVRFYWNTGTAASPSWEPDFSVFEGVPKFGGEAPPRLADMDSDGDLDFLLACSSGLVSYARNVGTAAWPEFDYIGWIEGVGFASGAVPAIALGDLDGDSDLDLVRITWDTGPECFENVGTPQEFVFVENPELLTGVSCPGGAYGMELFDVDGDGDPDLMLCTGGPSGDTHRLFLNQGATPVEPTSWGVIKAMYRQ